MGGVPPVSSISVQTQLAMRRYPFGSFAISKID
jgi:hypothetical protein